MMSSGMSGLVLDRLRASCRHCGSKVNTYFSHTLCMRERVHTKVNISEAYLQLVALVGDLGALVREVHGWVGVGRHLRAGPAT